MPLKRSPKTLSIFLHLLVLTLFSLFTKPVYGLTEDFYAAYLLGDGFGLGSTHLLHYNYGMHPILGKPLSYLFLINNSFNWYSLLLVVAHGMAGSVIFYCLLKKSSHWFYIIAYWLLFFVFEGDALLHINFNNTALILYTAAIVWLFTHGRQAFFLKKHMAVAIFLFTAASLFRVHVGLIIIGVSVPFFTALLFSRYRLSLLSTAFAAAVCVFFLHQWQEYYYQLTIKGWRQEELRRQQVYKLYNNSLLNRLTTAGNNWDVEYNMAGKALLVDTVLLHSNRLATMLDYFNKNDNKGFANRWNDFQKYRQGEKWFWINNRLYFVTSLFLLIVLPLTVKQKMVVLSAVALLITGAFYLALYARLMDYVIVSGLYVIVLLAILFSPDDRKNFPQLRKVGAALGFILLFALALIHVFRASKRNAKRIEGFKTCYNKIAADSKTLFVITSYDFPLQDFYIWDAPVNYPLRNFISNEHFLLNIQQPVLKNYGIGKFEEVLHQQNVLFWGNESGYLKDYFEKINEKKIMPSAPLPSFPPGANVIRLYEQAP
jgi:hypothetical protein